MALTQLLAFIAVFSYNVHSYSSHVKHSAAKEISRRKSIEIATKGATFPFILSFVQPTIVSGIDKNEEIGTAEHPIAIVGGGGRTGMTS